MSDKMSYESQWTAHGFDIALSGSDFDDRHVQISFINDIMCRVDLSIVELIRFRDNLNHAIKDVFSQDNSIQCPACGYTAQDAMFHADHQTCRRYPFFPGEEGKSHAK